MKQPLLIFFSLTYATTWICWSASAAIARGPAHAVPALAPLAGALFLLGTFAPAVVALTLTAIADGCDATVALLARTVAWRVDLRWYLFAVGYVPAIKLSAALVHRVTLGVWPRFGAQTWYVMAGAIVISTWVQAGEEIGWRGYALPRLTDRFGLGVASIIVGIIWACWHLPLFFAPESNTFGQSFPLYLLQVTALSVAAAWLYWRTNGSLLLVMLLHAGVNNTADIVPSAVPGAKNPFALSTSVVAWLTATLLWITAVYFLTRMRRVFTGK